MKRREFFQTSLVAAGATGTVASAASGAPQVGTFREPERDLEIADDVDVIVCGGGPAGIAAAVAAARTGASVRLFEVHGCLGGVWTAGLLTYVIDAGKPGFNAEILHTLSERRATAGAISIATRDGALDRKSYVYDPEEMKQLLEEKVVAAGVKVQLFTRVAAVGVEGGRLRTVVTESKSGRQAWRARVVIDATGDGDVGALAGCSFEVGEREGCPCQPLTMMALVHCGDPSKVRPFANVFDGARQPEANPKKAFLEQMKSAGFSPSYGRPTLFHVEGGLFSFMINHEYGIEAFDAAKVTEATFRARAEIRDAVLALRSLGGAWDGLRLVATAEQIGIRDGRRISGRFHVKREHLINGSEFDDSVTTVRFPVDIHAVSKKDNDAGKAYHNAGVKAKPYQIPLRALIAKEVDGLMMAGRCISGDFVAHASYRVTGNAVAMGEAAGTVAALAAGDGVLPHEISWGTAEDVMKEKVWRVG